MKQTTQEKIIKVKELLGQGKTLKEAMKETQMSTGTWYKFKTAKGTTLKGVVKKRKYTKGKNKPYVATVVAAPTQTTSANMSQ